MSVMFNCASGAAMRRKALSAGLARTNRGVRHVSILRRRHIRSQEQNEKAGRMYVRLTPIGCTYAGRRRAVSDARHGLAQD